MSESPTIAVVLDAIFSMPRSTSAARTSTVAEASFEVGSGSTSGVDDDTDAVLVMPSPASMGVT